jgi:hypothetical protein
VQKDGHGRVRGTVQISLSAPMVSFTMEPTCLEVANNLAWIEGVVTRTDDAGEAPLGATVFFRLRDNGQGAAAQPDGVSGMFIGPFAAGRCAARLGVGAPWPLTEGNVQIR